MRLSEISVISPSHYSGEKYDMDFLSSTSPMDKDLYKGSQKIPGGSGLRWAKRGGSREMTIYVFDPDMDEKLKEDPKELPLIGQLDLVRYKEDEPYSVGGIAVAREYRGKKIGLALYGIVLDTLGMTLSAGESQTPAGQKMWTILKSIPGVKVYGLMWRNPQFFKEKNLTDKGVELFSQLLKDAGNKVDAIEQFFKKIGGDVFVDDNRKYAFPVEVKNGLIHSDYVKMYGSFAAQLVARKTE